MKIWKYIEFALSGYWQIPKGDYCYKMLKLMPPREGEKLPYLKTRVCPYWTRLEGHLSQEDGYCRWMECGDYFQDKKGVHNGTFLLWDQVKECGIRNYSEKEERKMYEECMKDRKNEHNRKNMGLS